MPQVADEVGIDPTTLSRAAVPGLLALGLVRQTRLAEIGGKHRLAGDYEFTRAWWIALNSFKAKPSGNIFAPGHAEFSRPQYGNHQESTSSFKRKAKSPFRTPSKHASAVAIKNRSEKWEDCLTLLSEVPSEKPLVVGAALGLLEKSGLTPEQALEALHAALQVGAAKPEVKSPLTFALGVLKNQDFRADMLAKAKVQVSAPAGSGAVPEAESEIAEFATVLGVAIEDIQKFEVQVAAIPEAKRPAKATQEAALALALQDARRTEVHSLGALAAWYLPGVGEALDARRPGNKLFRRARYAHSEAHSLVARRKAAAQAKEREAARAAEWAEIERRAALPKSAEEIRAQQALEAQEEAQRLAEQAEAQRANAAFDAAAEDALRNQESDPEKASFYELLLLIRHLHLGAGGALDHPYWAQVFAQARLQSVTQAAYILEVPRCPWASFAQDTYNLTFAAEVRAMRKDRRRVILVEGPQTLENIAA